MDINEVLKTNYIKDVVQRVCGSETELITRPASYMVRGVKEEGRDIHRVIILPPRGFTADKINQTNSHDEAEYATIEIKGAVKNEKSGFSILKNCLLVASIPQTGAVSELNKPYMTFSLENDKNPDLSLERYSSGIAPFVVVKSDGYGFYHNLINMTDDWLVLQLYKRLRLERSVNLKPVLSGLLNGEIQALESLYSAVIEHGDAIFQKVPNLIENIVRMPVSHSVPVLAEMLYTHDTGKHEACSVFAVILKIGKMHPVQVTKYLQQAIINNTVPSYYAEQLIKKIENHQVLEGSVSKQTA